jgi:hypothetical protein
MSCECHGAEADPTDACQGRCGPAAESSAKELGRSQLPRVRNFAAGHRSHGRRFYGCDSSCVPVESHELDLEGFAVGIDVNYGSDIADLQAFVGNRRGEHDPIVFSNHAEGLLLARIRGDESRSIAARVDNPYGPDQPPTTLFSVRREPALHNKFLAVHGSFGFHNFAINRDYSKGGHQALGIFDREAKGLEEPRLAAVVWMCDVQQVLNDLVSLDDGELRVPKLHAVSSVSHESAWPSQHYSSLPPARRSTSSTVSVGAPGRRGKTGTPRSKFTSTVATRRKSASTNSSTPWPICPARSATRSFNLAFTLIVAFDTEAFVTIEFYASSPLVVPSSDASPRGWAQNLGSQILGAANHSRNDTSNATPSLPWAQGVAGSNPVAPTNKFRSIRSSHSFRCFL